MDVVARQQGRVWSEKRTVQPAKRPLGPKAQLHRSTLTEPVVSVLLLAQHDDRRLPLGEGLQVGVLHIRAEIGAPPVAAALSRASRQLGCDQGPPLLTDLLDHLNQDGILLWCWIGVGVGCGCIRGGGGRQRFFHAAAVAMSLRRSCNGAAASDAHARLRNYVRLSRPVYDAGNVAARVDEQRRFRKNQVANAPRESTAGVSGGPQRPNTCPYCCFCCNGAAQGL